MQEIYADFIVEGKVFRLPNSYYERGIEKGIEQIINKMLQNGLTNEQIAYLSDLSLKKVEKTFRNYRRNLNLVAGYP